MRGIRADRLWLVGGLLSAVVLFAVGWLFFIGPQRAQTRDLNDQAAAAQLHAAGLQRRLSELRQQSADLPTYRARLAGDRQALPTTSGLPDLLRQLQRIGDLTGVAVDGMLVGAPQEAAAGTHRVYALPLTLTATGIAADLRAFLDRLQLVQPRAVLIDNVAATPDEHSLTLAGRVVLTLGVRVFVAGPDATPTATPASKPN